MPRPLRLYRIGGVLIWAHTPQKALEFSRRPYEKKFMSAALTTETVWQIPLGPRAAGPHQCHPVKVWPKREHRHGDA